MLLQLHFADDSLEPPVTIVHKLKLYAEDGSITKKAVRPNLTPSIHNNDQNGTTFAFRSVHQVSLHGIESQVGHASPERIFWYFWQFC